MVKCVCVWICERLEKGIEIKREMGEQKRLWWKEENNVRKYENGVEGSRGREDNGRKRGKKMGEGGEEM